MRGSPSEYTLMEATVKCNFIFQKQDDTDEIQYFGAEMDFVVEGKRERFITTLRNVSNDLKIT